VEKGEGEGVSSNGTNLNGHTCQTQGFFTGDLACNANCTLDTSDCTDCGNGTVDPGEECDSTDLDDKQCNDLPSPNTPFNLNPGGTLACNSSCSFDTAGCTYCGDGARNDGEECEGTDLGGADCDSATGGTKPSGTLSCFSTCTYNTGSYF